MCPDNLIQVNKVYFIGVIVFITIKFLDYRFICD